MAKDHGVDNEIHQMTTQELQMHAQKLQEEASKKVDGGAAEPVKASRMLLKDGIMGKNAGRSDAGGHHHKKGAFGGVFVPTCENMWGVLIFLRFHVIVGNAGIGQALTVVFISFICAFCTTSSMSATVSSGGFVSRGGPYYMISRALGPCVGVSVGIMYWLAITMLAVLETLGAVEGILMASPDADFSVIATRLYGSALFILLAVFVYGGITIVSRLGIFFVFVVFSSLFIYYFGLATAPDTPEAHANPLVTGLSSATFGVNFGPHYADGKDFGYALSVFFPCFTGILSGANRADILRDPPKDLRNGTFGAIIFSLFMYSSFMVLWGMVAEYPYLKGDKFGSGEGGPGRRLAGGAEGGYIVEEIVWNPFPHAAHIGIIISSLSQALQCLVVAPRLLQAIAKDKILSCLDPLAPLTRGEPKRALGATYVVGGLLVLIGKLDLVAPLLSMCFLVCYAFMNFSCFALTWLKSSAWRPTGIQYFRWRLWYMATGGLGFLVAVTIMFLISYLWALAAIFLSLGIYLYINWKLEQREWGSALDGIRYQLALKSLIQLEETQHDHVNWRPQVLILYRIRLADELKGVKRHGILKFCSQLGKGNGFCIVACVLESGKLDSHASHKAKIERDIIKSIMKEENLEGFAEVVVAPSWREGTNYIIQLSGVGGLAPNTMLLDWPLDWREADPVGTGSQSKATDFVKAVQTALAGDKAVLAIRGLDNMPLEAVNGTIDVWWVIHDGGFLILLSYLLVQHRVWRNCNLRVFAVLEGVTQEQATAAGKHLSSILRQRKLFYVDVEVILVDAALIQPYIGDADLRVQCRHEFLEKLTKTSEDRAAESMPLEIGELLKPPPGAEEERAAGGVGSESSGSGGATTVLVSDARPLGAASSGHEGDSDVDEERPLGSVSGDSGEKKVETPPQPDKWLLSPPSAPAAEADVGAPAAGSMVVTLNGEIMKRSSRAELVVMNLPEVAGVGGRRTAEDFMAYCDALVSGLDRVLFVHASGHEIVDIRL